MSLADAVSRRSRRRKLDLFLETMRPTAETTVLDVGVDDLGFGEIYVHNVGRDQGEFVRDYGERAISKLGWLE